MIQVSSPVFVPLLLCVAAAVVKSNTGDNLVRKRREWILPPKPLKENEDYTQRESIAKIRSDFETDGNIIYSLEGPGASENPFNVFIVHPKTGLIRVTKVLDRELMDTYLLSGVARYTDGREAEKRIDIRIKVVDENDNSPVFGVIGPGAVDELSPIGTSVMKITATDADEEGNENSQIAYSIVSQNPPDDMFSMKSDGTIYVKSPLLNREKMDKYVLTVKGQDLNGKPGGNTGTGTVTINIRDVNDNLPTLEKEEYEGSVEENTVGVEVMRIKAEDLDLKDTDNWLVMFEIIQGNEAGYFSITTDPKTNEGILMLDKAVDYENVKDLALKLIVKNKAEVYRTGTSSATGSGSTGGGGTGGGGTGGGGGAGSGGGASSSGGSSWHMSTYTTYKTYPIKINVKNQPEGPRFDPKVKAIPISEGGHSFSIKEVIARYPAIDGDTGKPAENVRYVKGSDPGNWLTIDPETAEIKLNKLPDRESPLLVNGTYFAKVLCITEDMPSKTATGTIVIQVEDFNDNCPILTNNIHTLCTTHDAVIIDANDKDASPYGPPFHYSIVPEGTEGKWQVEQLNETAAILRSQETMWPGIYEVEVLVKDEQGHACPEPQKVNVHVCTCEDGVVCGKRSGSGKISKGAELGPGAIGLLLLGLLLLLLIPLLLLFCQCGGAAGLPGGFTEMPFDTKSILVNYRTEGPGENTTLINLPTQVGGEAIISTRNIDHVKNGINGAAFEEGNSFQVDQGFQVDHGFQVDQTWRNQWETSVANSGFEYKEAGGGVTARGIYDGMALPDHFLGQYYTQKLCSGNENLGMKDGLLVYDYEGQGSSAGSIGCCSLLESDNDLQFLDDLDLKFKTLAEVCGGKKISTEVKQVITPLPSTSISTETSVSSLTTAQQLPPPPKLQVTIPRTEQTVIKESSEHSQLVKESTTTLREGISSVKQGVANQGQMLLLQQQQPVYYTTAPMLQPMQYVVQPQVQNTMLLAEAPATNLQGMVLVNGTQAGSAQGMVVQGQTVMASGQIPGPGMVLVERSGVQGVGTNLIHAGNLSGSQPMMVMEGKIPVGSMQVLKGGQTHLVQGGTLHPGGLSRSQKVLVVGGSTSSGGQLVHEAASLTQKSNVFGSQKVLYSQDSMSTGSQSDTVSSPATRMSTTPTYRKVVVQETREIH